MSTTLTDQNDTDQTYTGLDLSADDGAQTAEYGIVTLAAVGFAGVLALVLSSGAVQSLLTGLVEKALSF
ncbi:DUF4244 domain-containing protein [Citricoccus sp. NR2]|uniref:DUF4244 domain-containing protein n=1 Tax=Citricoccus sp. NR2 TaxID=3004095 RepID=UPI0022DE43B9|nr:DUF4244 domain-containing protein [Citricoccus sp. NR2]WBL20456.1 DUF4244 domain-containing protein [Citricoccus sp. NR2]